MPSKTCQRVGNKAYENSGAPTSIRFPVGQWAGACQDFYQVNIKLFNLEPLLLRRRHSTGWDYWDFGGSVCYTSDYCSDPFTETLPTLRGAVQQGLAVVYAALSLGP